MSHPHSRPLDERMHEARRLAEQGYGAEDLVVRLALSHGLAKQLVLEAAYRKLAKAQQANP